MTTEGLSEKGCYERERRRSGVQQGNVPLDPLSITQQAKPGVRPQLAHSLAI